MYACVRACVCMWSLQVGFARQFTVHGQSGVGLFKQRPSHAPKVGIA